MFNLENNIYKYLGLTIVILFFIYIVVKSLNFQVKIIEKLTNNTTNNDDNDVLTNNVASKMNNDIKNKNDKNIDIMNINKYRTDYENIIISLDEYTNNMMFLKIMNVGAKINKLSNKENINSDIMSDITDTNQLKQFLDSLNSTMKYIDSKK